MQLGATEVLVVDCQATAARLERGFVLEIGWAATRASDPACGAGSREPICRQVAPPPGATVPRAVARITGLTERELRGGAPVSRVWDELLAAALPVARGRGAAGAGKAGWAARVARGAAPPPAPTVVHFARFEEGLFRELHRAHAATSDLPLEMVCTHEIARRLLPDLPRRGLRALAGYFGRAVGALRRCREHVEATIFVWRELVATLAARGVCTWPELRAWLAQPVRRSTRRVYPMPRELRLALPDRPGIYRLLRRSGDVLYVGKATSLRKRVNQHFTKQAGIHERTLELLAQARDVSFVATETALEAALLESDEIKLHRPPYNVALLDADRAVWFAAADLSSFVDRPDAEHFLGPFGSTDLPASLGALAAALDATSGGPIGLDERARILGVPAHRAPDETCFRAGLAAFREQHREGLARPRGAVARLRALGASAWARLLERGHGRAEVVAADEPGEPAASREGRAAAQRAPRWDPELVRSSLDERVVRAALVLRRARWLAALACSSVRWAEPAADGSLVVRVLVLESGDVVARQLVAAGARAPVPPGSRLADERRLARFDVARLDRLRVLTTELRRILQESDTSSAEVRFDSRRAIRGEALLRALRWV